MLTKLKYDVHFPTPLPNGRRLSADLIIGPGFWAVTGPNESGKSMVFEVARWLMFGAAALRGKADDYKTMTGEGEFLIRGNVIGLKRTSSKATMTRNGDVVATGTKPVNAKMIEELGFGMAVFDIANSINQGEVEKLGDMRPTERKAMVDSVLGLNQLDHVVKWAVGEATALDKQASGLRERLSPPAAEPARYPEYRASTLVQSFLSVAREELHELAGINGWLANERVKPVQPTCKIELPAENLKGMAARRKEAREAVSKLEAQIKALPETAAYSAGLLDAIEKAWVDYNAWAAGQTWLRMNPNPGFDTDFDDMRDAWQLRKAWETYDILAEKLRVLTSQKAALEHLECPNCKHDFVADQVTVARLDREMFEIQECISEPKEDRPATPRLTIEQMDRISKEIEAYDFDTCAKYMAMDEVERPILDERQVQFARQDLVAVAERAALLPQLVTARATFEGMADFEAMLAEREQYEAALPAWRSALADWETWVAEKAVKEARKLTLANSEMDVLTLEAQLATSQAYERQLEMWRTTLEAYNREVAIIKGLEEDAKEYRKVREVMTVLRTKIKQHVLPSLNLVASQLLRQMTGGQRSVIFVDEDFNVSVDTQDLDTLSGSGKACANLALRIALGQVLTHRVMPIMLADEIDASMDSDRASWTQNVLKMLEQRVQQVILVSHKDVDAPNHIRLGGSE